MKKILLLQSLQIAKKKLPQHNQDRFLHWSFIVQRNKILDYGTNCNLVPPVHQGYHQLKPTPKTHSEVRAYHKARGLLDHSLPWEMINIRLNNRGLERNSSPCCCCYSILKDLGCSGFYFSTTAGVFLRCV